MASLAREVGRGTTAVFLAEAIAVPAGLLIVALLSRTLGPAGYGRYGFAVSLVSLAEWLIVAALARTAIIALSDGRYDEPEPVVIRSYLFAGLAVMVLVVATAWPLGVLFGSAQLSADVSMLALDIPLFALAQAQRSIVTGRGMYAGRASAIAVRWISRLAFTWLFLTLGMGVTGAILAWPVSSVAELASIRQVSWGIAVRAAEDVPAFWRACGPPFLFAAGQRLLERIDLMTLKAAGASAPDIGIYVSAQNISVLPGLLAGAMAPVLTAALTRTMVAGKEAEGRRTGELSLKASLYTMPLSAIFFSCGSELVTIAFGPRFVDAGSLSGWLVAGFCGIGVASASASILGARGRLGLLPWISLPVLVAGAVAQALVVPKWGMTGAAMVNAVSGSLTGLVGVAILSRVWAVPFPVAAVVRTALATAVTAGIATLGWVAALPWPVRGAVLTGVAALMVSAYGGWRDGSGQ